MKFCSGGHFEVVMYTLVDLLSQLYAVVVVEIGSRDQEIWVQTHQSNLLLLPRIFLSPPQKKSRNIRP